MKKKAVKKKPVKAKVVEMYEPSVYRALDVRVAVSDRGLKSAAKASGVEELTLAKYCLKLPVPRSEARKIEQTLLPEERRA